MAGFFRPLTPRLSNPAYLAMDDPRCYLQELNEIRAEEHEQVLALMMEAATVDLHEVDQLLRDTTAA